MPIIIIKAMSFIEVFFFIGKNVSEVIKNYMFRVNYSGVGNFGITGRVSKRIFLPTRSIVIDFWLL